MDLQCRLCGLEKTKSELVITLQSQSENVNLVDLVEYFCRVDISRDPSLNQNVCKVCKVSLETFMYFCDTIEKHQKVLKQIKKEEKKASEAIIVQKEISTQKQRELEIKDADLLFELFNGDHDEDLDSPASTYQTEDDGATSASESTNQITLRNKEMKNCSVVLEKLDIAYEPSDTETSSEDEEEEEEMAKSVKRRRSSEGNATLLPSKRMRISPIKVVR
jgi:Zinc-finger associated domain (zf-AD)